MQLKKLIMAAIATPLSLGFTPQSELWQGRLAMIGFIAYILWDLYGYSVLRDVLRLVS